MVSVTRALDSQVAEDLVYQVLSQPPSRHYIPIASEVAATSIERRKRIGVAVDGAAPDSLEDWAISFDTNAVFNLARHGSSDVFDFLAVRHHAPLILSAQVLIEFWNNLDAVSVPFRSRVQNELSNLKKTLEPMGDVIEGDPIHEILDSLNTYEWVSTAAGLGLEAERFSQLLEVFTNRNCTIRAVDRARFGPLGEYRLAAKAPPGFMDKPLLGDFFVWADALKAMLEAKEPFSAVILVTDDDKRDWKVGLDAHPALQADVRELFNCEFKVIKVGELIRYCRLLGDLSPSDSDTEISRVTSFHNGDKNV